MPDPQQNPQSGQTVPMFSPDGTLGDIPQERVPDAMKANFTMGVSMLSPDGTKTGIVPHDRVEDAAKSGFIVAHPPAAPLPAGLQGPPTPPPSFMDKLETAPDLSTPHTGNRVVDTGINALQDAGAGLIQGGHQLAKGVLGVGDAMDAASEHPGQTAKSLFRYSLPGIVTDAVQGKTTAPQETLEPLATSAVTQPVESALKLAGNVVAGGGIEAAGEKALGAAANWSKARSLVPGENYTPIQHQALSGVLARGTGMGKDYFPKDVATTIASPLRQAAADNPVIANIIHSGAPEDSLAATQHLLDLAKHDIDMQHQTALRPVSGTPVDMKPVQDAVSFPSSLKDFAPDDAAAVSDLKARLGNVKTLGGMNDLRMYLNRELAPEFRKNAVAAGRSGAVDSAMSDALSATREHYYDQLEKATGQDFSGLKRTEGGLIKAQEALGNAAPQLASKEALAGEPKGVAATAADALQGGRTIARGPVSGTANMVAEKILKQTPLKPVQEGLQRFFSNLPEPTKPGAPPVSRFTQAPALLPAGQPQVLPKLPANAGIGPVDNGTAPPRATGFNVSPAGEVRPGPTPPASPATVTPAPAQTRALPAQAGPEGEGIPPAPAPTAPPLNQATASQRTNPPLAPNPQPVPRGPGFTVNAQGQAVRTPAALLSPPEAAQFSKSAWLEKNPKGNVDAAAKRAAGKGYLVVD